MDAGQDVWEGWLVLSDHRSFSTGHGSKNLGGDADVHDEPVDKCKDIGVVPDETKSVVPDVIADLTASDDDGGEEEKEAFQSPPDATADGKFAQEEEEETKVEEQEEDIKKEGEEDDEDGKARPPQCVVFSVGKLKVNGIGALCSFGVAAATVCIFLIGGRMQQHHHRQQEQQKIQLQFYGDDKRIQQVVQQTSRLNQAMSSVMGAGGASSTRANISFGGFYDGF